MTETIIEVKGLTKRFADKTVIDQFSYNFEPNVYAVVGPNGCGKSTLLSLLAGGLTPDEGNVVIQGISLQAQPVDAKQLLGYAPATESLYQFMTGEELINFVLAAKALDEKVEIQSLINGFGIEEYLKTHIANMSQGTKKKFALLVALMGKPKVVLLDEPGNELDSQSMAFLKDFITQSVKETEAVVVFSSHDEALVQQIQSQIISYEQFIKK